MLEVLRHTVMITGFVFVMMLVIEYINVVTKGAWHSGLAKNRWGQYFMAAALGAIPGCLGAFAVVAMYSHRVLSIGALVAAMIATSGDEAFVMFAMFPGRALVLTAILFIAGVILGSVVDLAAARCRRIDSFLCDDMEVHEQYRDSYFPRGQIVRQWRECTPARGILAVVLVAMTVAVVTGQIGHHEQGPILLSGMQEGNGWNWVRISLLVASLAALVIVCTVHDHFLEEHLWNHIARKHIPRVFLWVLGVLIVMYVLSERLDVDFYRLTREGRWFVLAAACLVGLIPQSGPHMVFVALYAAGAVPFGILLASSIVQDGHGMLPLLAHSRKVFVLIKAINFAAGIVIGAVALLSGFE